MAHNAHTGGDLQGPKNMKAYVNRDDIDFSNVNEMTPTQACCDVPVLYPCLGYGLRHHPMGNPTCP